LDLNLKDKVVIVTGGATGIGRATVERFAAEGANVVVWDVATDPRIDVTDSVSVQRATDDVIARVGRIDVLVIDSMAAKTPLAKLGEPGDIANAYVWLASDAAKFVSGAVLSVDGGLVLGT
jgi:NAD(P)-dependent dehydrogenase (short-subunit alcohol dehydrogenase family)